MDPQLKKIIDKYGSMKQWQSFDSVSFELNVSGVIWRVKGHANSFNGLTATLNLHRKEVSLRPFPSSKFSTSLDGDHVKILTETGAISSQCENANQTYQTCSADSRWQDLQLANFIQHTLWTYFTLPFSLANDVVMQNQGTRVEQNETWNKVKLAEQTLYLDESGLIKRRDYWTDRSATAPAAHYPLAYTEINGLLIATKHRVLVCTADFSTLPVPVVIAIDIKNIKFNKATQGEQS